MPPSPSHRDRNEALPAKGDLGRELIELRLETKGANGRQRGRRQHALPGPEGAGRPGEGVARLGGRQNVVVHREIIEQLQGLEAAADPGAGPPVNRPLIDPVLAEMHLALRQRHEPGDGIDHGRLASSVGTDQAEDLSALNQQGHVVHRNDPAEAHRRVVDP